MKCIAYKGYGKYKRVQKIEIEREKGEDIKGKRGIEENRGKGDRENREKKEKE